MLERYTSNWVKELWGSEEEKFSYWLKVEIAVLHARKEAGEVSGEALQAIQEHAGFDVAEIHRLEEKYGHDMIAFIGSVNQSLLAAGVGTYHRHFHEKLTSYDVEDPALVLMLRTSTNRIIEDLRMLDIALVRRAREHRWTKMIERTHGQWAEPGTFGHLLLVFASAVSRSRARLEHVVSTDLSEGKISGATGVYAGTSPDIERRALEILRLKPAAAETQILQRDRIASLLSAMSIAGASIEQIAKSLWVMMRSDCGELVEPRGNATRGSSRMAHKKNPVITEKLIGMARLLRGYALAAAENVATFDCREISQSSVERHIIPDAFSVLDHMATKATSLIENLVVCPARMLGNLMATNGVWAGARVRELLMARGLDYDTAYEYIQRASFAALERNEQLRRVLEYLPISDTDARSAAGLLGSGKELDPCFDVDSYIGPGIEHIFNQRL